jgi:DNA-binding response OmpR family regulator
MYILVVDDEPQVAKSLSELLIMEDHEAIVAANLAEAQGLIQQRRPDLVFLDMNLPDGSGLDLMNAVEGITFIIITGTPEEQTVDAAFDRGAAAYLVKPFSLDDVLEAIADVRKS